MLGIRDRRKKSIKYRLVMDVGIILISVCVFNYFLVNFIYEDVLSKNQNAKTEVVSQAAVMQARLMINHANDTIDNISRMSELKDKNLSLEEKVAEIKKYKSVFAETIVFDINGKGMGTSGKSYIARENGLFEDVLAGTNLEFEVVQEDNEAYIVLFRRIYNAENKLEYIVAGAQRLREIFNQIKLVSNGEICFLANYSGDVVLNNIENEMIEILEDDQGIKNFLKKGLLHNITYEMTVEDTVNNHKFNFRYGMISDSEWVLGIIDSNSYKEDELESMKVAMVIAMFIVLAVGIIMIYMVANSVAKGMLHIATHLKENIENEFKDSVPEELLKKEDELGEIAQAIKDLEEEMNEMLTSVKESLDYLNDQITNMNDN